MKRHLFWIVELFIWLLVLFLVSGIIMFAKYNVKKNFNTYQIFLPDVDGLIVGAPVRVMGIHVGYVNQIDIVGSDVYVKFIITQQDVKIPRKTIATVEFSGLGGSKSLELYPPTEKGVITDKLLIAQSPKRIHDSLGLLSDMFDKVINITYDVSNFMDQVGLIKNEHIEQTNKEIKCTDDFLNVADKWLDKAQKQCNIFNHKLNGKKAGKKDERRQNQNN